MPHNISEFTQRDGRGKKMTKRDNNFVWNNNYFLPNFNFLKTDLFIKDHKTLMLSDNHDKTRNW